MWIRLKRTLLLAAMLGVGVTAVDATLNRGTTTSPQPPVANH